MTLVTNVIYARTDVISRQKAICSTPVFGRRGHKNQFWPIIILGNIFIKISVQKENPVFHVKQQQLTCTRNTCLRIKHMLINIVI